MKTSQYLSIRSDIGQVVFLLQQEINLNAGSNPASPTREMKMKLIYIDTETTGLDKKKDDIIQLAGIISADGNTEKFNFLIRPREGYRLSEGAYLAHKKTKEEIDQYPPSSVVFPQFMALLGRYIKKYDKTDKLMFVAYNAMFDMEFIRAWFDLNGEDYFHAWFHFPALDVMQAAAFHLIGKRHLMKNFQLSTVYEEIVGKPMVDAHDALADTIATKEILNKIIENQRGF